MRDCTRAGIKVAGDGNPSGNEKRKEDWELGMKRLGEIGFLVLSRCIVVETDMDT